ncbi:hypothetical protein [Spirosoma aerophilum]
MGETSDQQWTTYTRPGLASGASHSQPLWGCERAVCLSPRTGVRGYP